MTCPGTLIWHPVDGDDEHPPSCIVVCDTCGMWVTSGVAFDEAHRGNDLLRGS